MENLCMIRPHPKCGKWHLEKILVGCGMGQGDDKMGQKGTNSIFVMTHDEIKCIPPNRTVTYAHVVVDFRPQKADPHQIRITAEGNLIYYSGKLLTWTADLTTSKLMWNSVLSTEGAKYMCLDIKNFTSLLPWIVLSI
jgi:hypothetical protein